MECTQGTLYTDGAALRRPDGLFCGAWACIYRSADKDANKEWWKSGCEDVTTNNRMELFAVVKGLRCLSTMPPLKHLTIITDSKYVQMGISRWMSGWKCHGWTRRSPDAKNSSQRSELLHADLWMELDGLRKHHGKVEAKWVKGHHKCAGNKAADELCREEMNRLRIVLGFM
jgi:ribonuclease HI